MRIAKAFAVLATSIILAGSAGAAWGMPDALTDRGREIQGIYGQILVAAVLMFLLVVALLAVILVRFREGSGNGRATHEKERHSTAAEVAWLVGPLILVTWIGIISYQGLVSLDAHYAPSDATGEIRVTGARFSWEMDYSGMAGGDGVKVLVTGTADAHGNVTLGDTFHVPADTVIRLNMTSADVIHAFQVLDGNNAAFSFNDVNPLGEHKWTPFVTNFPAGTYHVQCNKLCGNPGHAYMRAEIVAEPKDQFDAWLAHRAAKVGAELTQDLKLTATATGFTPMDNVTLVKGTRLVVEAVNPTSAAVTFSVGGKDHPVPAGKTVYFGADFPNPGGANLISNNGGSMGITVVDAEIVNYELADFKIQPKEQVFTAGHTYLVKVHNAGAAGHNLYIGNFAAKAIEANSPDVGPGGWVSFLYKPTKTGAVDLWCNVSGHAGLGMLEHGSVH